MTKALEIKIAYLEGHMTSLKTIADLALETAKNALIEIKAMKESTHKIQFLDPYATDPEIPGDPLNEKEEIKPPDLQVLSMNGPVSHEEFAQHYDLEID